MKIWELRELGKRDMVLDDGSTDIQNIRIYFYSEYIWELDFGD